MTSLSPARAFSRFGDWIAEERNLPGPRWPLNVFLVALLAVSPVPLAALGTQQVTLLFWLVLVIDLAVLFGLAVATFGTPALFVGVIILWFALQRVVVAIIAPEVSADLVRLLLTYKEGFYGILLAAGVVSVGARHFRGECALPAMYVADIVAVLFLAWLALVFISDPQSSSAELTYTRRFAAPVLFYLGGRLLVARQEQLSDSVRLLLLVAIGVALFGLLERFALDIEFWRSSVEATTFYEKQVESGLLPENWTVIYKGVPDGIFISLPLEVPVRRLVSTYLEPTTLSSFLAFALLLLLFVPDLVSRRDGFRRAAVAVAIVSLVVAVVATLSRGGIVTFLAGAAFIIGVGWLRAPRRLPALPRPLLLLPIAALMAIAFAITSFDDPPAGGVVRDILGTRTVSGLQDEPAGVEATPTIDTPAPLEEIEIHPPGSTAEGASKHLRGLTSGLEEMITHPFGRGLGATGNWSDTPGAGNESTIGVLAAQTGIIGFGLYIGFFAAVIASLVVAAWRQQGLRADLPVALAGAMFGLFIVSWVSESASGLLGNAFYLLFAGWALALASPVTSRLTVRLAPDPMEDVQGSVLDAPASSTDTKA